MFNFSVKGEYAVRAILVLSLHPGEDPLQVKSIARREGISFRFLEQVMSLLKKEGFVESVRGPRGGYRLAISPDQILLGDVLQAVEGSLVSVSPSEKRQRLPSGFEKKRIEALVLQEVWAEVNDALKEHLDSISFADLCERKRAREEEQVLMFHI
ncbi:MAG: RrF2 family transcriptional regulator [Nitrospiria bacterium]